MPRETLEAIMLVGGKGTRLRPLTLSAPKPLLPTAGVPFLTHQLARAAACGITHVVLATSYRAEMFTEAFGDGSALGLSIDYVCETSPLGTGGGIRNASSQLHGGPDDPIVILNGDILSAHDLSAQVDLHRKRDAAVTLHLVEVDDPSRYGCVPTDAAGRVTAFLEKTPNPVTNRINAGCYVFRRSVIDQIPAGRVVSVEHETFPSLISADEVMMGYHESAYWLDVGTPEAFVRGSCDLVLGRMPSTAVPVPEPEPGSPGTPGTPGESGGSDGAGREFLLLEDAQVAHDAHLSGGTVAGAGSVVATGAVVHGSVLFDEATIGSDAVVRDSIVGRAATIANGVVLDGVVIGDGAFIGPGNELARGLRVWPGVRLEPTSVRFSTDA
jgi:mannose-1-phosphate guanylyltransferase